MLEFYEYDFEIIFFECELQLGQWMTLTFNLKSRNWEKHQSICGFYRSDKSDVSDVT